VLYCFEQINDDDDDDDDDDICDMYHANPSYRQHCAQRNAPAFNLLRGRF